MTGSEILELGGSTARVSTPLLFAALGGWVSERSGVINIALEGLMLVGAFAAASCAHVTGSPWMGALGGMMAGAALAGVYAFTVIPLRANQVVAGTAINMLAAGITPLLGAYLFDSTSGTPSLPASARFHSAPIWIGVAVVGLGWVWTRYTRTGLWVRFAGENPEALDAAGVRVARVRWVAVLVSGALAGMGGSSLSIFLASSFSRDMTAGRGFMALAALIFGKWKPVPAALACLLFGFFDALQIRLQGLSFGNGLPIPVQFIQVLPYAVTILVLAGFVGKSSAPKALGM
ncbi:MAG: ABC transporter permease [Oligoflexia bacterium]|nr:ABC transporter permease [Oligoflexia bacterium]